MAPDMSAGDRAELRRRKILAKKNARMAYAAGTQSTRPSTVEPERIPEPPPPCGTSSVGSAAIREGSSADLMAGMSQTPFPFPLPTALLQQQQQQPQQQPQTQDVAVIGFVVPVVVRRMVLVVCAVVFAGMNFFDVVERWTVSAVEFFAMVEMLVCHSQVIAGLMGLRRGDGAGRAGGGLMDMVFRALRYQKVIQELSGDLCVYLLSFMCTWHVLKKL